jgi:predicted porin
MKTQLHTASVLALAALLGATSFSASAQSSVTIYGILDMYLQYGKGDHTETAVQSGGISSSRLGFKGSEDLGNGNKAIFTLESGILADTGAYAQGGLAFGRQAWVGLSSSTYGALTLGRQYVPQYNTLDAADPFGTGAGSAGESGVVSTISRANNSVVYTSPKFGDFSGTAMIAMGETTTGSKSNGNIYAGSLKYAPGALTLEAAVSQFKRATDTAPDVYFGLLTAGYDFGSFKLTGGYQQVYNLGSDPAQDRQEAFAGVLVPVGEDTFSVGVGAGKAKDVDGSSASQWSLGYTHPLSKRTKLYGFLSHINNGSGTAYTTTAATGLGPTTSLGRDVNALLLGIRHAF